MSACFGGGFFFGFKGTLMYVGSEHLLNGDR